MMIDELVLKRAEGQQSGKACAPSNDVSIEFYNQLRKSLAGAVDTYQSESEKYGKPPQKLRLLRIAATAGVLREKLMYKNRAVRFSLDKIIDTLKEVYNGNLQAIEDKAIRGKIEDTIKKNKETTGDTNFGARPALAAEMIRGYIRTILGKLQIKTREAGLSSGLTCRLVGGYYYITYKVK